MIWQPRWYRRAESDLMSLDHPVRRRITEAVRRFAETEQGDLRKLRGNEEEYRLRVEDWRVRVGLDHEQRIMHVLRVLHRREAYR